VLVDISMYLVCQLEVVGKVIDQLTRAQLYKAVWCKNLLGSADTGPVDVPLIVFCGLPTSVL